MASKCFFFECEFNEPVRKLRSVRASPDKKKFGGHSKIGKRENKQVSGRCLLGMAKRLELCPQEEEELEED